MTEDVARQLKKSLDITYGGEEGWQVIVGRKFSAMVTHRKGFMMYLTINHVSVMFFRQK